MVHYKIGGVPEHFNIPWQIAMDQGLFKKQSILLDWIEYPGGTGAMAKDLREGKLDIAVLLTEGIVADIAKGNPSKIISQYVSSPLNWGIHVPAHSTIQNIEEIEGKRYAISRIGSGSHLMAFVDASQRGFTIQEEQLIIVGDIVGARKAFKNNEADVFLWEKFMTKPLVDAGEFRRIGECPTPWPCFVIAVREELLHKNPENLKKLLEIIKDASDHFMTNTKAADLVALKFDLKPEDAQAWHQSTRWDCGKQLSEEAFNKVIGSLSSLQLITGSPEYHEVCAML